MIVHVVGLQRERQRRQAAEEVGADEAELGTPEREDDERDGDPPGAAHERVARRPPGRDREAVARAADARESAAHDDVDVAVEGDADPHRVRSRGRLADRAHVQPQRVRVR